MDAAGRETAGAVAAGELDAGPAPVEAGPAPIAFFSAALMISSLRQTRVNWSRRAIAVRLTRVDSSKRKQ